MAFYLVSAVPRQELMEDLSARLQRDEFTPLRPFGPTLSRSLKAARQRRDGGAVWEEEIVRSLGSCHVVLAIVGAHWVDAKSEDAVRRELLHQNLEVQNVKRKRSLGNLESLLRFGELRFAL